MQRTPRAKHRRSRSKSAKMKFAVCFYLILMHVPAVRLIFAYRTAY